MAGDSLTVAVPGAGRMGQQVVQVIDDATDCQLAAVWSRNSDCELAALLAGADVAIDFTLPEGTREITGIAAQRRTPLVCGVTGLDPQTRGCDRGGGAAPCCTTMSPGIAVMSMLLPQAANALGADFQAQIREIHHIHKNDAPSGTAIALREALGDDSIHIESRREGEVIGDHSVRFTSDSESIEIAHSVSSRRVFATGAVAAARWLAGKPPGLYRMTDIGPEG